MGQGDIQNEVFEQNDTMSAPEETTHIPVLLQPVVDGLPLHDGDVVVDGTFGGGGYTKALCQSAQNLVIVGIDQDKAAMTRGEQWLAETENVPCTLYLAEANFRDVDQILEGLGIETIQAFVVDLGLSSFQLETSGRGFSFQNNEPLHMTFADNPHTQDFTAETIVNTWSEKALADVLYGYGEERAARRIAKALVAARKETPITTTQELVDIVIKALPPARRRGKTHPATKTFQALRIATNDELGALEEGIQKAMQLLAPQGRIAVVSFHSLEDRITKRAFKEAEKEGLGKRITKKPITPTEKELQTNPRARSAKLRIFEKE